MSQRQHYKNIREILMQLFLESHHRPLLISIIDPMDLVLP